MRGTTIKLSKAELQRLKDVKTDIYGGDVAEAVPHGQALQELIDAYEE
jgi:hypothetical protein